MRQFPVQGSLVVFHTTQSCLTPYIAHSYHIAQPLTTEILLIYLYTSPYTCLTWAVNYILKNLKNTELKTMPLIKLMTSSQCWFILTTFEFIGYVSLPSIFPLACLI